MSTLTHTVFPEKTPFPVYPGAHMHTGTVQNTCGVKFWKSFTLLWMQTHCVPHLQQKAQEGAA